MVPRLSISSWRFMPMPLSATTRTPLVLSGVIVTASTASSPSRSGCVIAE